MTTRSDPDHPDSLLESFLSAEGFDPDPFQLDSFSALDAGRNLLVSAPTGSGKTLVGEYAAHRALSGGGRCFYTTPIKALSNQKFRQFRARFGPENVGLLTGDHSIDPEAPVVVMTTEVLRNMIYSGSPALHDLDCVVMDEIHYLGDRSRGVVWEEIILHLPQSVRVERQDLRNRRVDGHFEADPLEIGHRLEGIGAVNQPIVHLDRREPQRELSPLDLGQVQQVIDQQQQRLGRPVQQREPA